MVLSAGVGEKDGHKEDVSIFIAWAQCMVCVIFILLYSGVTSLFSSEAKVCTYSTKICDKYYPTMQCLL